MGARLIIQRMVINMNESRLCTITQIEEIGRVLKRFDYPQRNKRERSVLLRYLRHTSGYRRAQLTRLVAQWSENRLATVPLVKRYRPPAVPFARKYTPTDIELLEGWRTNEYDAQPYFTARGRCGCAFGSSSCSLIAGTGRNSGSSHSVA